MAHMEYLLNAGHSAVDRVLLRADFSHDFSHPSEHGPTPWDCGPKALSFSTRFVSMANRASGAWRIAPGFPKAVYIDIFSQWIAEMSTRSRRCGKQRQAVPGSSASSWTPCLCSASNGAW